jgi:hypothetical protein
MPTQHLLSPYMHPQPGSCLFCAIKISGKGVSIPKNHIGDKYVRLWQKLLFVVEGTWKSLVTISVVSLIVNTLREYPGLKNSSYMWRSILHYLGSKKDHSWWRWQHWSGWAFAWRLQLLLRLLNINLNLVCIGNAETIWVKISGHLTQLGEFFLLTFTYWIFPNYPRPNITNQIEEHLAPVYLKHHWSYEPCCFGG